MTNYFVKLLLWVFPSLFRKQRKQINDRRNEIVYDSEKVDDKKQFRSKVTSEVAPNHPESEASTLAAKTIATIDDIHDRSDNNKDTATKSTMKNVLYEPGKSQLIHSNV